MHSPSRLSDARQAANRKTASGFRITLPSTSPWLAPSEPEVRLSLCLHGSSLLYCFGRFCVRSLSGQTPTNSYRIREAQARGEFDDLPGMGAPLALDDDALVPEELRVAYRMLKNAGFVPPEIEAHREIREIEQLLHAAGDEVERTRLLSRINFLLTRSGAGRRRGNLRVEQAYLEKIAERLERSRGRRDK